MNFESWKKIHFFLAVLLAAFPALPLPVLSIGSVAWTVLSVALAFKHGFQRVKEQWTKILLYTGIYWLFAMSLLYSSNLESGSHLLYVCLTLLILPVSFVLTPYSISQSQRKLLFTVYFWSCVAVALFANGMILFNGLPANELDFSFAYRTAFDGYRGAHPTYLSIFFFFALLIKLHEYLFENNTRTTGLFAAELCGVATVLITGLLLASRTPIIGFTLVAIVLASIRIKKPFIIVAGGLSVIGLLITLALFFPSLKDRAQELTAQNFKPPHAQDYNSVKLRAGSWVCASEVIGQNWLAGVGIGDVQDELNNCYAGFNAPIYEKMNFDAHNQYLHVWLAAGLAGLLALCLAFFLPAFQSLHTKDWLYLGFLVFFAICCVTETLLSRQLGLFFYGFFNSLFAFHRLSNKDYGQ